MCLSQNEPKQVLVFTTERLQFVAVTFDESSKSLRTLATGDLRDRVGRQIDRGQLVAASPSSSSAGNRAIAMQFYEGHLKIVPIGSGEGSSSVFREKAFNVLLSEFNLRDLCFLAQPWSLASPNVGVRGGGGAGAAGTAGGLTGLVGGAGDEDDGGAGAGGSVLACLYEDESRPGLVGLQCYQLDTKQKVSLA